MPHSNIDAITRTRAKRLHRQLTKAEAAMWNMLHDLRPSGACFRRESDLGRKHDLKRHAFMPAEGFTIPRFENFQVLGGPDHVFITIEQLVSPFFRKETAR